MSIVAIFADIRRFGHIVAPGLVWVLISLCKEHGRQTRMPRSSPECSVRITWRQTSKYQKGGLEVHEKIPLK